MEYNMNRRTKSLKEDGGGGVENCHGSKIHVFFI